MLVLFFASAVSAIQFTEIFNGYSSRMISHPASVKMIWANNISSCEQYCVMASFACQSYAFVTATQKMSKCFLYKKPLNTEDILTGQDVEAIIKVRDPVQLMLPSLSPIISGASFGNWIEDVSRNYEITLDYFPSLRNMIFFAIPDVEAGLINRSDLVSDVKALLASEKRSYETLVAAYLTIARAGLCTKVKRAILPVYLDGFWTIYIAERSGDNIVEAVISIGGDGLNHKNKRKIFSYFGKHIVWSHFAGYRNEELRSSSVALDDALTVINIVNNILIYNDDHERYELYFNEEFVRDTMLAAISIHWNIKNEEVI